MILNITLKISMPNQESLQKKEKSLLFVLLKVLFFYWYFEEEPPRSHFAAASANFVAHRNYNLFYLSMYHIRLGVS